MAHVVECDMIDMNTVSFYCGLALLRLENTSDSLHRCTHHSLFAENPTCQQCTSKCDNYPVFMQ